MASSPVARGWAAGLGLRQVCFVEPEARTASSGVLVSCCNLAAIQGLTSLRYKSLFPGRLMKHARRMRCAGGAFRVQGDGAFLGRLPPVLTCDAMRVECQVPEMTSRADLYGSGKTDVELDEGKLREVRAALLCPGAARRRS